MGNYASDQKNTRFYGLKLSKNTDGDLIELLDSQVKVQAFLKALLRKALAEKETAQK